MRLVDPRDIRVERLDTVLKGRNLHMANIRVYKVRRWKGRGVGQGNEGLSITHVCRTTHVPQRKRRTCCHLRFRRLRHR